MLCWILIILGSIGLDQLTKWQVVEFLEDYLGKTPLAEGDSFPLWQDVLHFTYIENTGAAFGSFEDHRWVFMSVSTVAIVALIAYFFWAKPKDKLTVVALACITGGGIGNMIDRIRLGYVVDFIDFTLIDFAVFNIADSFVCVGVGLMFLALILTSRREAREKAETAAKEDAHDNPEADR